jgi:hypothetical protein
MQIMKRSVALAVAGSLVVAAVVPASAQVARPQAAQLAAPAGDPVTQVRWGWGWGVGAGVAAGALIGAGIAASRPYYYDPYYYGPAYYGPPVVYGAPPAYGPPPEGDAVAYCMQRYKSYDPGSGTFLGYDGLRHPCP